MTKKIKFDSTSYNGLGNAGHHFLTQVFQGDPALHCLGNSFVSYKWDVHNYMMRQHNMVESAQDWKPEDLNHVNILTVVFLPYKVLYIFSEVLYGKVLYTL